MGHDDSEITGTVKSPKSPPRQRKPLSVFDEYEQRGGVLEDYEDLNSDKSSEMDGVLS